MPTIRELRLKRGLSREALAVSAGVGTQTVMRAEKGAGIRKASALAICRALDVSLEQVSGLVTFSAVNAAENRRRAQ